MMTMHVASVCVHDWVEFDFVDDVADWMVPIGNDRCREASTCAGRHARILRRRKHWVEVVVLDRDRRSCDNKLDHCTWPDDDDEEEEGLADSRSPVLAADAWVANEDCASAKAVSTIGHAMTNSTVRQTWACSLTMDADGNHDGRLAWMADDSPSPADDCRGARWANVRETTPVEMVSPIWHIRRVVSIH